MTIIETRLKKWGNSFGIVIPMALVEKRKLKENDKVSVLVMNDSSKVLKETFGMLKGRLKKSGQQIKDELREELYN
jgi:antitoxin component of MazEF toxin-antitoxin module